MRGICFEVLKCVHTDHKRRGEGKVGLSHHMVWRGPTCRAYQHTGGICTLAYLAPQAGGSRRVAYGVVCAMVSIVRRNDFHAPPRTVFLLCPCGPPLFLLSVFGPAHSASGFCFLLPFFPPCLVSPLSSLLLPPFCALVHPLHPSIRRLTTQAFNPRHCSTWHIHR